MPIRRLIVETATIEKSLKDAPDLDCRSQRTAAD
jgi:hypothetical protein